VLAASRLQIGLPGVRGSPRAGAGKIPPRPRRTVGGEKAGRPEPYTGGTGARAPAWIVLQVLVALVLVVSPYRRECATFPWRFIRRAARLVNGLRPERDSNAGPTAYEVVLRSAASCCFPDGSRFAHRLTALQCLRLPPRSGTRLARGWAASRLPGHQGEQSFASGYGAVARKGSSSVHQVRPRWTATWADPDGPSRLPIIWTGVEKG
jgi:hypothetical protein